MNTNTVPAPPVHTGDVQYLKPAEIGVDPRVQRPLDDSHVAAIAADFRPDSLGTVEVSQRADGSHIVLDGQHRLAALRQLNRGGTPVRCNVHRDLTLAEEAALFRTLNFTRHPKAIDRFRVGVVQGDADCVAIHDIYTSLGWRLQGRPDIGCISCVSSMRRVYLGTKTKESGTPHPAALKRTLHTLTEAFGHGSEAVNGTLVAGLGQVYLRYGDLIDIDDMVRKLQASGTAVGLIGRARGLREYQGGSLANACSRVIVDTYNASKRTRRLEDWR